MKVWVLKHENVFNSGYWTGDSLKFTADIERAVWFVRRIDAERALAGWMLIDAKVTQVSVLDPGQTAAGKGTADRDEPGAQSAQAAGLAANPSTRD